MTEYFCYLKSDFYKLRRTGFFLVHLIFSVCGAVLMLIYAGISDSSNLNKMAAFAQIYAIAYPFVVSIVCQIIADQEMKAGFFQNILMQPSRAKGILSKLTWLLCSGFVAVEISAVLFGMCFTLVTGADISIGFFIVIPAVLWAGNLFLYGVHLILAMRFGRNLGISLGAAGSLLSALLQTGLGTGIWYVIPYGFGIRFSQNAIAWLCHVPADRISETQFGILSCFVITCVIIAILIVWFSKYDGAHTE